MEEFAGRHGIGKHTAFHAAPRCLHDRIRHRARGWVVGENAIEKVNGLPSGDEQ